jgi:hypothetical protein
MAALRKAVRAGHSRAHKTGGGVSRGVAEGGGLGRAAGGLRMCQRIVNRELCI